MDSKKYVLVKLKSGECLIGSLIDTKAKKYITLENPLIYQTVSIVNEQQKEMKNILMFKEWNEFSADITVEFPVDSILTKMSPNDMMVDFYQKELSRKEIEKLPKMIEDNTKDIDESSIAGILGNMSFSFNFQNPDHFQMFMDNIQMSIEGLIDEMDGNNEDDEDFEDEDTASNNPMEALMDYLTPQPKRKKAKKRKMQNESFDLPFEKDADPNDPKSWSNDPRDYLS